MSQTDGYLFKLVKDELVMLRGVGYKMTVGLIDETYAKYAKRHAYLLKNEDAAQEKERLYAFFGIATGENLPSS